MKVILSLILLTVTSQAHAGIDFNGEINQARAQEYELHQKVIADSGIGEMKQQNAENFKKPEGITEQETANYFLMKLRAKKIKFAKR